ncbi:MAG: zinc-binding dehydrogenase, partial [Antricoccus sp.]
PIGQMAVRIAKHLGAGRVIGIDSVPERLALAQRYGAETVDLSTAQNISETIIAMTAGRGPDSTIDAVGMEAHGGAFGNKLISLAQRATGMLPDAVAQKVTDKVALDRIDALLGAIKGVRRGGTVSVSGVYGGEVDPLPMMEMFDRGIQLRMGQAHVRRWTDDILPLVSDPADPLGTLDLTTHRLPLAQAPEAYEMFRDKSDGCIKVVLQP